jgi:CO dehydrogenase/acetyl-CoA synthase alpha subunit
MKKHTIKTLTLSRDTLRTLDSREAAQVGGAVVVTKFQDTCISCSRCVNHCI